MQTGIELIAKERKEQIEKHGYTLEHDKNMPGNYDINLINAAMYCLDPTSEHLYPKNWDKLQMHKFRQKPRKERLAIAGALIAAAIDCAVVEMTKDELEKIVMDNCESGLAEARILEAVDAFEQALLRRTQQPAPSGNEQTLTQLESDFEVWWTEQTHLSAYTVFDWFKSRLNTAVEPDFEKMTGHKTPELMTAYEQGRANEAEVVLDFVDKWNGTTNSVIGEAINKAITRLGYIKPDALAESEEIDQLKTKQQNA